jgi:hypothetical protein
MNSDLYKLLMNFVLSFRFKRGYNPKQLNEALPLEQVYRRPLAQVISGREKKMFN